MNKQFKIVLAIFVFAITSISLNATQLSNYNPFNDGGKGAQLTDGGRNTSLSIVDGGRGVALSDGVKGLPFLEGGRG